MDIINVMCEGTMKAAAEIIAVKGIKVTDLDKLVAALRNQIKAQYAETMQDLKDAMNAHMGEPMLRQILNVACNQMALDALKECKYV